MEERKQRYADFCEKTYVPIFSKPWWMDAVCGTENWDVWLYESRREVEEPCRIIKKKEVTTDI